MSDKDEALEARDFHINTAPEMDALERAAADGKHGRYYANDSQLGALRHSVPGASHHVRLSLESEEEIAGLTADALEQLAQEQDADAALTFLYIAHVLAPPMTVPDMDFGRGVIDFDDVLSKIGWDPRSTVERREMHRKIYQFIRFGERAQVVGKRRGAYTDKHTGELIDTEINAPLWRIHETEKPDLEQGSLFPAQEVPVRVELVMSRSWITLLTSAQTAQYLPMAEVIGAIPGNRTPGAWARVIGLALASFWRRNPRQALEGTLRPTRRELLERYLPKIAPVEEILNSTNPRRAMNNWCEALQILKSSGFLADEGEVAIKLEEMRDRYPRKNWGDLWLAETVDLVPGELIISAVKGRVIALPAKKTVFRGRQKKGKS